MELKCPSKLILPFLSCLFFMPAIVSAMGVELAVGLWEQKPGGDFSFKPVSGIDQLNVRSDLDYQEKKRIFGRVKIDSPLLLPNVYLFATPMKFSGRGSKDVAFSFGDFTFRGNAPLSSSLRLDQFDLGLFYGIPGLRTVTMGFLNIDLGIDGRLIDFRARVTGTEETTGLTVTEEKTRKLVLPMAYLGFRIKPAKLLSIEGEGRGVIYHHDHVYDLIGRVRLIPVKPIFVSAGYRYEWVKLIHMSDEVQADATVKGVFGEAGVEF